MPRPLRCSVALVVALSLAAIAIEWASTADAAVPPAPPKTIDTWAFCGVRPDDPNAATAVRAMAQIAGIDATFGPCNVPMPPYSPESPSNRYVSPDMYMQLVLLNATVGMKTVVYDDRLWSADPNVRNTAIGFWTPVLVNIAAWDMGDEFNPTVPVQWNALKARWAIMRKFVEPVTQVQPFVNFLPASLDQALIDLPGIGQLLSFDQYDGDRGVSVARAFDSRASTLMCAVNMIDHGPFAPTPLTIRADMASLIAAGCDRILDFTGFPVYDTTTAFGDFSVVDKTGVATNRATAAQEGSGHSSLVPVPPIRLLETRTGPGLGTVDSGFNGIGPRPADSVLELGVVDRAQIPESTRAVVLNLTVTGATGPGYVTVYPCGEARPTASNLNYDVGTTRAVAVVAQIGSNGAVCVYTQTQTDMIVDLTGFYSDGASFTATSPARLLETRTGDGLTTFDGQSAGIGRVAGGSTTTVKVAGRGGAVPVVPTDATAAAVNITAINPKAEGFVTVYPCDETLPVASTLNFTAGTIVANAALVKLGASGSICIFSNVETDLILDVNGYDATQSVARFLEPTRVLDTRAGLTTADGLFAGEGLRPADSVLTLPIGGRLGGGIPTAIRAAVLNITVTEATAPGFVTVYPCGGTRPIASTLNYGRGTTVANLAVAATTTDGKVCIYTQTPTHLVVDLSGYHT